MVFDHYNMTIHGASIIISREFLENSLRRISGRINRAEGSLVIATEDQSTLARTSDIHYVILIYIHICFDTRWKIYAKQSAELVTFTTRDATRFVLSLSRKYYDLYRKFIFVNFPDALCYCYCQQSRCREYNAL